MNHPFDEIAVRIRPQTEEILIEETRGGVMKVKQILPDELMKVFGAGLKEDKCGAPARFLTRLRTQDEGRLRNKSPVPTPQRLKNPAGGGGHHVF